MVPEPLEDRGQLEERQGQVGLGKEGLEDRGPRLQDDRADRGDEPGVRAVVTEDERPCGIRPRATKRSPRTVSSASWVCPRRSSATS